MLFYSSSEKANYGVRIKDIKDYPFDNKKMSELEEKTKAIEGFDNVKITFVLNNGTDNQMIEIPKGTDSFDKPLALKEGYIFSCWCIDEKLTTEYNLIVKIHLRFYNDNLIKYLFRSIYI